jgi:hypothetical protein
MSKQQKKVPPHRTTGQPSFLSRFTPFQQDLISIALLYVLTLIVFRGIVFENAAFSTENDTVASLSYFEAGNRIAKAEGVDVIWMPYFFSGMPTFGNVAYIPHEVSYIQTILQRGLNLLFLNGKWTWLVVYYFLGGVFMFLVMRVLKFSAIPALLGAVIFMLAPYNMGLASEGHGSKLMALSYFPLVFMLTHVLFERRDILSFGLLAAAIGTLALTNHMQIVYYVFIVIGLYLLYRIILEVRKTPGRAVLITGLFAGALVLGLCIASYIYLSVYEYSQFSIRGGGTAGSTGGLAWDYATNWSWHPQELFTLLIPSFLGFQSPYYWGTMPFTNSTIYLGILPLLLAVLAVVYNRTRLGLFLTVLGVIMILISFGKHFPLIYGALFDYLPFFNKFRVPVMVLHLLPFVVGVLAGYGMEFLLHPPEKVKSEQLAKLSKTLLIIAGVLCGILILATVARTSLFQTLSGSMFVKEGEAEMYRQDYGNQVNQVMAQLKQARFDLLWKDFVKFVLLAAASLGLVVLFLRKKVSTTILSVAVFGLVFADLLIVINQGNYISPKPASQLEAKFQPDATVAFLQQQPGLFRIFPIGNLLFMDNSFSYHGLQSIGGYSPAKLKIYQTMLDSCLYQSPDPSFQLNMNIVNMLNTEYLVAPGRLPEDRFTLVNVDEQKKMLVYRNPAALPRVFFVEEVKVAANSTEVFSLMNAPSFDAARTAVLEKTPSGQITRPDSSAVQITKYQSRNIAASVYTSSSALLVVSEVYYPAGWKAFVDGQETEILKTNYMLRSIVVPSGTHTVEFRFDPVLYTAGYTITNIAWAIALCCVLIGLWQLPAVRAKLRARKEGTGGRKHEKWPDLK